jgi:type VI secretion system secreted protein VgrG
MEKAGGDLHIQVAGNLNEKVSQNLSLQVGQNLYEKSGSNFAHEAGQIIHLKAGMTVVLEAGTELTLKVGGNFIDINPSGISIVGTMVMINSGGAAGSGCGSSPTSPKDPDVADDGSKGGQMN